MKSPQESQPLQFEKYENGMMPVIVQDNRTGEILMQAYTTAETLKASLETGKATFMSRSRGFWCKGDTSGDWLKMVDVRTDCDGDSLIYMVEPQGSGACHNQDWGTCFRQRVNAATQLPEEELVERKEWEEPFWQRETPNILVDKNREKGKLYFGIPSGSLEKPVRQLLEKADMIPEDWGRKYEMEYNGIVWRIRDRIEMATKVRDRIVDAGVTGKDYIEETGQTENVVPVADYVFSRASRQPTKLVLAGPGDEFLRLNDAKGKRIATEFPNLTRKRLLALGWKPGDIDIIRSLGKTEAKVQDGEADLCADITETGNTLRALGMNILGELFTSTPQLIANRDSIKDRGLRQAIEEVATALKAALDNETTPQSWMDMNVPAQKVEALLQYLSEEGYTRKAPTVLETSSEDWKVVRTIVPRSEAKQLDRTLRRKFGVDDVAINDVDYFVSEEDKVSIT